MTLTTLIIARHGNTFAPDEAPRRVGARTDLPLVESGHVQARKLGHYLAQHNLVPDRVVTSDLKRARQTGEIASIEFGIHVPVQSSDLFNEIDYGPDENQSEEATLARIGDDALKKWEQDGIMPEGWSPSPEKITRIWTDFAENLHRRLSSSRTMVVTSNGIARFALHLTGDWAKAREEHGLKLATGALGILTRRQDDPHWNVVGWNIRP